MDAQPKKTEDMTVAETLDAIFGPGATEEEFSGADLEEARQPYDYTPPAPQRGIDEGHDSPDED